MTKNATTVLRWLVIVSVTLAGWLLTEKASAQAINCPSAPQSRLVVGRDAVISPGGASINLRDKPSKSGNLVSKLDPGTQLSVLAGPTCAENFAWWQVALAYDATTTGWIAEGSTSTYYLNPTTSAITKATIPTGATSVDIQFNTLGLAYNGIWGNSVEADSVIGFKGPIPQDVAPFAIFPDYTEFRFPSATTTDPYRYSEIDVYSVAGYIQLISSVQDSVTSLKKILTDKPPQFAYDPNGSNRGIPALPIPNAAQVIAADVSYLSFSGGSGVRFITFYAQDVSPITSDRIEYYFQGLSQDGQYWISARFPITSSLLADKFENATDFPMNATDGTVFEKYYNAILSKLNAAQPTDFTPTLDVLDKLVQSITIKSS